MSAADAIRDFLFPILPGWRIQFGRWSDDFAKTDRFAVVQPAGGLPVDLLRRPAFTLKLIGSEGQDKREVNDMAEAVIAAMRTNSAEPIYLQPGEPVFMATDDGRPIFEIAITAITD
jgi:hypothetical protein